jgi:hypothetical protein
MGNGCKVLHYRVLHCRVLVDDYAQLDGLEQPTLLDSSNGERLFQPTRCNRELVTAER